MIALEQSTYLGPATVLEAGVRRVKLELPDEFAWALCALAFPYQPAAGDVVLAIGRSGSWYVIGVLKGSGATQLVVPGDLVLAAPRGQIKLEAAQGIEVRGPKVRIAAKRLELLAHTLKERFTAAARTVQDAFQLRVGRFRTRVDGAYDLHADRIRELADKDVKIDGTKINLG
jgi:hypothetical protein